MRASAFLILVIAAPWATGNVLEDDLQGDMGSGPLQPPVPPTAPSTTPPSPEYRPEYRTGYDKTAAGVTLGVFAVVLLGMCGVLYWRRSGERIILQERMHMISSVEVSSACRTKMLRAHTRVRSLTWSRVALCVCSSHGQVHLALSSVPQLQMPRFDAEMLHAASEAEQTSASQRWGASAPRPPDQRAASSEDAAIPRGIGLSLATLDRFPESSTLPSPPLAAATPPWHEPWLGRGACGLCSRMRVPFVQYGRQEHTRSRVL